MFTMLRMIALPLLMMGTASCGKEVVVGGLRDKEVETYATGDGTPEDGANESRASLLSPAPGGGPAGTHILGRVEGTISFDALVEVVTVTGGRELAGNAQTVVVRTDGDDTTFVARAKVRNAHYTAVRVTFTRVTANVVSGLVIGGIAITGQVNVSVPTGGIVVERPVPLGAPDEDVQILVDLDASAWLPSLMDRLVPATTFQQAVKIRAITR